MSNIDNNAFAIKISIGEKEFVAKIENNKTTSSFASLLPMTINMEELNGNEKYYYLPNNLPTSAESLGSIQFGDLMLWGNNCLVLFYESFTTSYSYTKVARIEDPTDLASALGSGSVTVSFSLIETK